MVNISASRKMHGVQDTSRKYGIVCILFLASYLEKAVDLKIDDSSSSYSWKANRLINLLTDDVKRAS